jgi:hypothetical protein
MAYEIRVHQLTGTVVHSRASHVHAINLAVSLSRARDCIVQVFHAVPSLHHNGTEFTPYMAFNSGVRI